MKARQFARERTAFAEDVGQSGIVGRRRDRIRRWARVQVR